MASVAIVTDTSSDLPLEEAEAAGVRLVPLTVTFGDETLEALTELSNEEFYRRLTTPGEPLPRTAAPNPSRFAAAYREALEAGASSVVCVTISRDLSATYASAVQAASECSMITSAGSPRSARREPTAARRSSSRSSLACRSASHALTTASPNLPTAGGGATDRRSTQR